jgi:hypothetical protein
MAGASPLAGLLDRAGKVFSLAAQLGRAFQEEREPQDGIIRPDPGGWVRHQPRFNEFCAAVLDLREAMQNPPDGFAPVARVLLESANVAKRIRDVMQSAYGWTWASYQDFYGHLSSVAESGRVAIRDVTKARRLDDPFAFIDQMANGKEAGKDATPPPPSPSSAMADAPEDQHNAEAAVTPPRTAAKKRSTERGEGRAKLIAALTKHHQYADRSCLNLEPIGSNELAAAAGVSPSTASAFFTHEFGGHSRYRAVCKDAGQLIASLKLLNNEFSPYNLYGRQPADELYGRRSPNKDDRDDEGDD